MIKIFLFHSNPLHKACLQKHVSTSQEKSISSNAVWIDVQNYKQTNTKNHLTKLKLLFQAFPSTYGFEWGLATGDIVTFRRLKWISCHHLLRSLQGSRRHRSLCVLLLVCSLILLWWGSNQCSWSPWWLNFAKRPLLVDAIFFCLVRGS